VLDNLALVRN